MLMLLFGALFIHVVNGGKVGDTCQPTPDILNGTCESILNCEAAVKYIIEWKHYHPFQRCGFDQYVEIVCCPLKESLTNPIANDSYGSKVSSRIADEQCQKIVKVAPPPLAMHIISGEGAAQGEFPHMVALGYFSDGKYEFFCGGSLISEKYVLTAAHCVDNIGGRVPEIARCGVVNISNNDFNSDTDIRIAEIISHPLHRRRNKYHNLALLRLASRVAYSVTQFPACLYTGDDISDLPLVTIGWVIVNRFKNIRRDVTWLKKANVNLVSNSVCRESYPEDWKLSDGISEEQFCAGEGHDRTDTCQEDSGGPILTWTNEDGVYRIVGITSFGRGCGSSVPTVYTRVYPYLQWIESVVWPNDTSTL